jgi:hypothetical protein
MWNNCVYKCVLPIAITGFLMGCLDPSFPPVHSPMASVAADTEAKTFTAKKDRACVYLYRDEFFAVDQWMSIIVDGNLVAQSVVYSYIRLELSPGIHEITSRTERDAKLSIDAKPGQIYFIHQHGVPGIWRSRSKLSLVPDAVGRQGVLGCKLLAACLPCE